jgi:hypothetical protein
MPYEEASSDTSEDDPLDGFFYSSSEEVLLGELDLLSCLCMLVIWFDINLTSSKPELF